MGLAGTDKPGIVVRRHLRNHLIQTPHFTEKGIRRLAMFTDDEADSGVSRAPTVRPDHVFPGQGHCSTKGAIVHNHNPELITPSSLPSTIVLPLRAESLTWAPWIDLAA